LSLIILASTAIYLSRSSTLCSKHIKLVGSTGGTRKEFIEIIDMSRELKVRVWKRFKLENAKEALQALFCKERDGRILLDINSSI
jgi:D-arabinose 1-dehydrogenase-like Zn-dependent alcohol dehydrogenase